VGAVDAPRENPLRRRTYADPPIRSHASPASFYGLSQRRVAESWSVHQRQSTGEHARRLAVGGSERCRTIARPHEKANAEVIELTYLQYDLLKMSSVTKR
jgi:hypothetical protein